MVEYKQFKIVFDTALERDLLKILEEEKIEQYQIFPGLKGSWEKEKKHLNTHVWPGTDSVLVLIVEKNIAERLLEKYKRLKNEMDYYITFKIIVQPVDVYVP
ncbi:hypothetical protein PM10SUCC1_19800 [Propionigenium maris DSM 9537]|uniref:Uncharacterized protein n=1 Tax=Propionigenium maris DSM 9537 TaxID=1123000 RepID=A0A9W6GMK2_9FUSO|nr:PG0541 family transporter-associated protein [Propionigenium maris]GLI56466.1 hypothetical protein PM10SUCC1_19800 [Propionigenium maris DSM 9537]